MSLFQGTCASLGEAIFGNAKLGDRRRTARLVKSFDQLCRHPGGSLPNKMAQPQNLKGLYRLMQCPKVTHAAILEPLRNYTLQNIERHAGYVLLIHDATELDYTSHHTLAKELGQVGKGLARGYVCHQVLAVQAKSREVLGLVDQILHHRDETPDDETLAECRDRPTRESLLWLKGTQHLPNERRLVDVCDRGADTFEFLEHECNSGRTFVIRASKPRKVQADHAGNGPTLYLDAHAQSLPVLGQFNMEVQPQTGRTGRKNALFTIRGGPVLMHPPHARHGNHGNAPLAMYVVFVSENQPPPDEKPITWLLLTNKRIKTFRAAWEVINWYESRWIVEEYHKGQKTGVGVEEMQFMSAERMEPAIALLSAVALTLLSLRDASRRPDAKTRPATTVIHRDYVAVLTAWRFGSSRYDISVHDFYYALARLGGHQNRKKDKPPGWLVLWRGWMKLQSMLDGYLIAKQKRCG
jgi:hypothetical protein